jgi:hypothetical protein
MSKSAVVTVVGIETPPAVCFDCGRPCGEENFDFGAGVFMCQRCLGNHSNGRKEARCQIASS